MQRLRNGGIKDLETMNAELDKWGGDKLLSTGAHLLEVFIEANFTGCIDLRTSFSEIYEGGSAPFRDIYMKELSFDFNHPFKHARLVELVWLSKLMLLDREEKIANTYERNVSICRCVQLWQYLLDEPAMQLKQIADRKEEEILSSEQRKNMTSEFHLERIYAQLGYYEYDKAEEHLKDAIEKANLTVQLSGVLGKRTKFQQTNIAQLVAKAFSSASPIGEDPIKEAENVALPTNVRLDDDTLLERVSTLADDSNDTMRLTAIQLACIFGLCAFETSTQHNDELLVEKCSAYVDKVISQARNWAVYACALLRRCAVEKRSRRRVQRACLQAELLAKLMDGIDDQSSQEERRRRNVLVLASGLPPSWRVQAFHAQLLRSLGCTAEALRIYEKQEAWDNVIECYRSLGQLEKAERLVRELVAKDDHNPLYYCMLGDITLEPNYYEVAIEKSKGRCARAHLSLGELMMIRHHYDTAYESLRRGLELQPIKLGAWFNLGHCAWKMEHWQDAACAYHRCVQLEPEHFEAWNNLSASYIRLGQKPRAKKILQEALKFNYEHAKMWENYVLLCVDTQDVAGTIQALHRLIDLDGKHQDDEVIAIVTSQLLELRNKNHDPSDQLVKEMCKLLARMISKQTCSSKVWRCYAALHQPNDRDCSVEQHEKYLNLLERAYLADYNRQKWYTEEQQCSKVLKMAVDVFEEKLHLAKLKNIDPKPVMSEVRMNARPLVAMVERVYGIDASNAVSTELREIFTSVKQLIEDVICH